MEFLLRLFILQGGRCKYSYIPIFPYSLHPYKISVERINPLKGYSKNNIALIVVGLNGRPAGQFKNLHLTENQKQIALDAGKFNQEYWNTCTKLTTDIEEKCKKVRDYDRQILLTNLNEEMKQRLYFEKDDKYTEEECKNNSLYNFESKDNNYIIRDQIKDFLMELSYV